MSGSFQASPRSGCGISRLQSHRSQPSPPPNSGQACRVALPSVLVQNPWVGRGNPPTPPKTPTSPFAYSSDLKRLSKVSHSSKNTDESKLCLITPNFIGDHLASDTPVAPFSQACWIWRLRPRHQRSPGWPQAGAKLAFRWQPSHWVPDPRLHYRTFSLGIAICFAAEINQAVIFHTGIILKPRMTRSASGIFNTYKVS